MWIIQNCEKMDLKCMQVHFPDHVQVDYLKISGTTEMYKLYELYMIILV